MAGSCFVANWNYNVRLSQVCEALLDQVLSKRGRANRAERVRCAQQSRQPVRELQHGYLEILVHVVCQGIVFVKGVYYMVCK